MTAHFHSWRDRLPSWLRNIRLNFYRLHLCYFIFAILLSSVIVYGSTTNGNSGNAQEQFDLRYIDALFLCASAMTNSGLNVVNLGAITGFQQAVLFILIPLGNVMVVSMSTVYIRKYFFRKKIRHFLNHSKAGRQIAQDIERDGSKQHDHRDFSQPRRTVEPSSSRVPKDHEMTAELRNRRPPKKDTSPHHLTHFGGFPLPWESSGFQTLFQAPFQKLHRPPHGEPHNYLSFKPALDSRGRFLSLDERQREELGGVEYKALVLLGWLLPAYLLFWFTLGIVILVPYSYYPPLASVLRTSQPGNLEPGCLGVRVGGLYAVLISNTAPALQILYLAGMYISGFPIIISLRQTNIYEERSLGIENNSDEDAENKDEKSYISEHVRKQLAYDLWWLILAIWLITIIERHDIVAGGDYFTIWAIVFETVSAYGTVGLSLGVPYDNYSFSGTWHTLSKLILICVMIRGRHRGLPYAIDRAVLLPGEELMEKMDKEVNGRGSDKHGVKWQEEEQRVRREQEGSQAESQERGQDPEGHDVKGTEEGLS
ncbi:TrkH-domain-containing protein [Aureobasidium sp. EXF-10728]|nr:TrkH-domain-containing protein [Aureobasidium sp. EXF-10728]